MDKGIKVIPTVCFWCKGECGLLAHVKDDRLISLEEDTSWPIPHYPPTKGCARRKAAAEYLYHPGRLHYPKKRVGARGEGKWQPISWRDALDEIADKISRLKEKYGPETVASTGGTARTHDEFRARFMNLFGSPNLFGQERICFGPRSMMADTIVGMFPNYAVSKDTNCILLLGGEPLTSRPMAGGSIMAAKKRGAKMIVVDPVRTQSATMADIWLPVRPGTDAALLLGFINVIVQENLYDKKFVEKWCFGFDKLLERLNDYPLSKVAEITGVSEELIQRAARLYATNSPACAIEGEGLEHAYSSAEALHARWILSAICGNLDVKGGEVQFGPPGLVPMRDIEATENLSAAQWRKMIGSDRFRMGSYDTQQMLCGNINKVWGNPVNANFVQCQCHSPSAYRTIITGKPYPITALFISHSNPMVTEICTPSVHHALTSPNLQLLVTNEFFMTPSAELADYVLPVATWLERPDVWAFNDYGSYIWAHEAAVPNIIEGQYEHYIDFDIWRELALRLGQAKHWPWKTYEEACDYRLKPLGYTVKNFPRVVVRPIIERKYEKQGFATSTGKVEIYSNVLEKLGYDPLPKQRTPPESPQGNPELAKSYPYHLITGRRNVFYYHSEWRNIDSVRKNRPYPRVQIHPDIAATNGIKEGDWVWIETRRGKIRQQVHIKEEMRPDVVNIEHGWWYAELPGPEPHLHGAFISNANVLTSDDPDQCNPEIGSYPLRTALCKIYKAEAPEGLKDFKTKAGQNK